MKHFEKQSFCHELKAVREPEGELMSRLQIHARHDGTCRLCETKINRELWSLHAPTTQRQSSRWYHPNRIRERGGYDRAGQAFNPARLLHELGAEQDRAPAPSFKCKSSSSEAPNALAVSYISSRCGEVAHLTSTIDIPQPYRFVVQASRQPLTVGKRPALTVWTRV
jgi:hypothetical protein